MQKRILIFFLSFYSLFLHSEENPEYKLMIIGCGRSGTTYIARLLQSYGLDIGHEELAKDGISNWLCTVDYEKSANKNKYGLVLHQIRNPLEVISSWYINNISGLPVWEFISKYVPEIAPDEPFLNRCAKYWYYWNLKAEEKADWSYRIEDIDEVLPVLVERFHLQQCDQMPNKMTNHWKEIDQLITWNDLKDLLEPQDFENIKNLSERYGYSID